MSNTELLQENRSQGWACATSAPPHFAARIIEIRRALLEKRSIPAPSRAYVKEAELRYALATPAVRKANIIPAPIIDPLRQKLAEQAERIRVDDIMIAKAVYLDKKDNKFYRDFVAEERQAKWDADPEFQKWLRDHNA